MQRYLFILISAIGIQVYAAEYTPFASSQASAPAITMQSVNNASYFSAGSTYSSSVYEVGSDSPSSAPGRGVRKAPPGTGGESGYDPSNPQFAHIGDAVLPLALLALAYCLFLFGRQLKKRREENKQDAKSPIILTEKAISA